MVVPGVEDSVMPIDLQCDCGKRLSVGDYQAGRKVRCPACQELLDVPGEADERGYRVEHVNKCPQCKREWPSETVVCVECGYNFQTGKRMRTVHGIKTLELRGANNRATLMRDRHGVVTLTMTTRFLFWTISKQVYRLDDFDAIYTDYSQGDEDSPEI